MTNNKGKPTLVTKLKMATSTATPGSTSPKLKSKEANRFPYVLSLNSAKQIAQTDCLLTHTGLCTMPSSTSMLDQHNSNSGSTSRCYLTTHPISKPPWKEALRSLRPESSTRGMKIRKSFGFSTNGCIQVLWLTNTMQRMRRGPLFSTSTFSPRRGL